MNGVVGEVERNGGGILAPADRDGLIAGRHRRIAERTLQNGLGGAGIDEGDVAVPIEKKKTSTASSSIPVSVRTYIVTDCFLNGEGTEEEMGWLEAKAEDDAAEEVATEDAGFGMLVPHEVARMPVNAKTSKAGIFFFIRSF